MAYGLSVKNGNDEVVVDDEYPCLFLVNETSYTGTSSAYSGYYDYDSSSFGSEFMFFNMPKGAWIARRLYDGTNPVKYISNQSSLSVREVKPANQISGLETGYGVIVKDSTGQIVYSSNADLIPVRDFSYNFTGPTSFSPEASWVSFNGTGQFTNQISGEFSLLYFSGVERDTTTGQFSIVNKLMGAIPFPATTYYVTRFDVVFGG